MWVAYAFASAFFAGIVAILAKIGIRDVDSDLATALRTIVVVIFAWLVVLAVGSYQTISEISLKSLVFLILSGLATGGSWLCYFKALQIGDVNKVVPVDKSSIVLTMLLSFILLGEGFGWMTIIAMVMIGLGTYMMIERKETSVEVEGRGWLFYAIMSAILASLTAILGKVGIEDVESNLGTAIRTIVVLIMAWIIVFGQRKQKDIKNINKHSWTFIIASGVATGLSWLCFFYALQSGPVSVVVPIDKLSIVITVIFSYFILHERLGLRSILGLIAIVIGTLSLLI